ncbi:abnormal spindle-like microcephaly-associated protein homolog isoform X2 [Orbicella faveolata]|uniref:abnormal spindle-like microcephaly-associated protein homolog isoform X2 n=1 Tax=Orbicella faveolata TaxID=48498 RepID=UPI0009E1A07D|nr:abnormal spindle-like microcephaly-associated protein homolog isoform X2 [Orbicella faveolata]
MLEPRLTPSKENCQLVNKVHSKRAQWYSPCKNSPKIPLSPEPDAPTLKLTHFATIPKISFGTVNVGSSKTETFVVLNPHPMSQTLEIVKCPTDRGFTLDLNDTGSSENCQPNFVSIPPKDEMYFSVKWEPKESGNFREIIRFKWENSPCLQVVVFGAALGPKKARSAPKSNFKKSQKNPKAVLQPSQALNTCHVKASGITVFEDINTQVFASKNVPVEHPSEVDLCRDTYLVTNGAKRQPNCKAKVKPSTPKVSKLISKPITGKTKKTVVSKKKVSPISGTLKMKPKPKVKLKVAAKGIPQRKLQLVKTPRTNLPRHPMPFAAKNMYYDERWIEKQEEGFTKWLNFVLTPPDATDSGTQAEYDKGNVILGGTKAIKKSQPLAPTREVLSFRTYTARRKMARLRRSACLLYQSEPLGHVICKIEAEVENGRLAIRPDKKLHADLGIKQQVIDMILSYNTLWLRIGLETIYGEILPIYSNNDVAGLTHFLSSRLLGNPDIARAFAHPQVPGLCREGYVEQLGKFTLKKFLLLVLFLDRAKLTRLIDHNPCLFNKDASFKSSRSLLLTFSREYLKGEGDVTKHLSFLGYSVTHSQRAIDEVDYAVKNIAIDLRDGLRLTRVAELLTQDWQLSASLRVPAISRLQKIHNVDVFINALKERGVLVGGVKCGVIDARHVVDGHREKTLALLWQIIFHFQVNVLLSEKLLKEEIAHLESTRLLRVQLTAADNWADGDNTDFAGKRRDSSDLYFQSDRLRLLFKWCKIVCRLYGLKIENFTVSFSDGRALCYLLHHYHPSLLPRSLVKEQTSLTCNPGVHDTSDSEGEEGMNVKSWTATFSPGSGTNVLLEELKNNERENFRTMAEKVQELGGVPLMTKASDMSYTIPDEKVVITYVAYLCARLLDLREETKAARCIQMAWRRHRLRRQLERKKNVARIVVFIQAQARSAMAHRRFQAVRKSAVLIQSVYRGHLFRKQLRDRHQAARCIQTHYRAFRKGREVLDWYRNFRQTVVRLQAIVLANQKKRHVKRNQAATIVQAAWRGYVARRRFVEQRAACVKIQAFTRGAKERRRFLRLQRATLLIQQIYGATMLGRRDRARYLQLRKCVIALQSFFRGKRDRRVVRQIRAAIKIQSHVRAWQNRARFVLLKRATIKIQAHTRMCQAQRRFAVMKNATRRLQAYFKAAFLGRQQRHKYETQKAACVKIQSFVRCYLQRSAFLKRREAAVLIQSLVRKNVAQRRYLKLVASTVTIQRKFRALLRTKTARQKFKQTKLSIVMIQSRYRGYRCRKHLMRVKQATVTLQTHTRRCLSRNKFLALKHASSVIQTRYRALMQGRHQNMDYQRIRLAIVRLQAIVRGNIVRKHLLVQYTSAIMIQASFRQYSATKRYRQMKHSAIVIQQHFRSVLLTRSHVSQYQRIRSCAMRIQAHYRGYRARQSYNILKAAVVLQSAVRGWKVRKDLKRLHFAAVLIQTSYRSHVAKTKYRSLRQAAMVLQLHYRSLLLARQERSNFKHLKQAAIKIQSSFRGYQARKRVERLRATKKIQATYRGYLARKSYNISRKCIVRVQALARGYLARKHFHDLKKATIMLQRRYRARVIGMRQYVHYHVQRGACIVAQAAGRSYLCRKRYLEMKNAAIVLQQRYRAMHDSRRQRERFLALRSAAIRLQACVRGWLDRKLARRLRAVRLIQATCKMQKARKEYLAIRRAIVKVQAQTRMLQHRRRFTNLKNSALVIQRRFRATILCKRDQLVFHFMRGAVITLQMAVRGYLVRARLRRMRNAAVKIQACVRGFLAWKQYEATKRAVLVLQLRCRAWLLGRAVARNYNALKSSTLIIQSAFRGYTCRSKYLAQKSSAVIIQAAARRHIARRVYLNLRVAALVIQQRFRTRREMQEARQSYLAQRKACIMLQTEIRAWCCRRQYNAIRSAAITVQQHRRACIRTRVQRTEFLRLKNATIVLQSYWKMSLARSEYERTRKAAIQIQAVARMWKLVMAYHKLKKTASALQTRYRANTLCKRQRECYQTMRKSATVIQARFRGFKARQRVREMLEENQRRHAAALKVQRYYRGFRLMEETYFAYHVIRGAIITLQSACRMYAAQKFVRKLRAVIRIQANFRRKVTRRMFLGVREVVCRLQATVRRNQVRKRFVRKREAVVTIQQWYRAQVTMKKINEEYHCFRHATILIQSHFRRHCQRQAYLRVRQTVVLAQSMVRMRRQRTKFLRKRSAAVVIQGRYRAYMLGKAVRQRCQLMQWAATRIQSCYRGSKARGKVKKLKAAILIQTNVRAMIQRRAYCRAKQLVIVLQATARARRCQKNYREFKHATILLQRKVRANFASRKMREEFLASKHAAVKLQSCYRGWKARCVVCQIRAAILIQRWFRSNVAGRRAREEYRNLKEAAIILQAAYRGHCGRVIASDVRAARTIQAAVRGFITRKRIERQRAERLVHLNKFASAVHHHLNVIRIQRYYRRARAMALAKARMDAVLLIQYWWRSVLERQRFTRLRSAVIVLQRATRKKLETKHKRAAKIQALFRGVMARKLLRKLQESALRIQAFWRGYRVRCEVFSLKVKRARKRIKSANAAATEPMKLCNRTRSALDFLLQCKNISRIVGALVNLEVVTRLSEVCCQQVVKDGALPVIFKVIKKCNRSLPHLEVIKYSISILFNVGKYPSVYRAVYEEPDAIDTLVELLANFRDKSVIFSKTCCLLVLLCRDSSIAREILNMKKIVEDIKSVHNIAERNHRLETKRNMMKSKSDNTISQLAPPTPCKATPYKARKSNSLKWQRRLDMVQDPLEAVRLLVRGLGLVGHDQ